MCSRFRQNLIVTERDFNMLIFWNCGINVRLGCVVQGRAFRATIDFHHGNKQYRCSYTSCGRSLLSYSAQG